MDVIVTHENADFDGIACLVAARRLYPGSVAICPSSLDRSVREYVRLHETELKLVDGSSVAEESISRLVAVDTSDTSRFGRFSGLATGAGVELVTFDHHTAGTATCNTEASVSSTDGALITTLVELLAERKIAVEPAEATLFALAIHQDTGSLTYESTTVRDVEALAYCYRCAADIRSIERYTRLPLGMDEREVLQRLLSATESLEANGVAVQLAAVTCEVFPDGASKIVDKLMSLVEARALVCLLEHEGKTSCIIRSRGASLEAGTLAAALGGGGHRHAGAATIKGDLAAARATVKARLPAAVIADATAGSLMSSPVRFVAPETSVRDAISLCRQTRVGGLLVGSEQDLLGVVSREDLDSAMAHDLSHAPVNAVMSPAHQPVSVQDTIDELRRHLAQSGVDRVAVEREGRIVGVVTRRDLLRSAGLSPAARETAEPFREVDVTEAIPALRPVIAAIDDLGGDRGRVFLVGGAVRDVLLDTEVVDIDLAVEGSGIEFARELASRLAGRATPYGDFGTATVTFAGGAVDVATTRSEFYASPAALPSVESASIENDLFRRDFTINAMAIELDEARRGRLVDPFGGERDLRAGSLRVLHSLSFVDDPTRLLRAARYEGRYGFRLDERSDSLARSCVKLGLVGNLSGARVGNELVRLLREKAGIAALRRLVELGVLDALHASIDAADSAVQIMQAAESTNDELEAGATPWRLRLAVLTQAFTSPERYRWLDVLQLARRDVEVIARAAAVGPLLVSRTATLESTRAIHDVLANEPIEAVVLALAQAPPGSAAEDRLRRFVVELRHVSLSITGDDLAQLGLAESPAVGHVLDAVLGLKLEGSVDTSEEELAAARRLIESGELQ